MRTVVGSGSKFGCNNGSLYRKSNRAIRHFSYGDFDYIGVIAKLLEQITNGHFRKLRMPSRPYDHTSDRERLFQVKRNMSSHHGLSMSELHSLRVIWT